MITLNIIYVFIALCISIGFASNSAAQQRFPTKPIRFILPNAPGGSNDVVARLIGEKLSASWGQPIIVDSRPGGNNIIAADALLKSTADGHTILLVTAAHVINPLLLPKHPYDAIKDFESIGMIAKIPNILVVNPNLPVKTVADYVRFAKDSKDGITFASSGSGSSIHLSGEMFKMQAKIQMLHIPYKGSAPAVTDLLGGQVESMFDNAPSALPHIQAGKLRAIAVTSAQRSPSIPDVPTLAESGYPNFDVQSWFAFVAPAGTPKIIVEKLNAALNKALLAPDVRQRLQELAATPEPGSPEKMRDFQISEVKRWREVVKASGAKAE